MTPAHFCRNILAALWGILSPLPKISDAKLRTGLETGRIRKILLIRPHQGIGDLILATPVFRTLQESYPQTLLHFIGTPYNAAAVRHNPRLARIWEWNNRAMRNPLQLASFFRKLRRERFDLAIVLFSNAPSLTSFLIARLSGAALIASPATDNFYGGLNWSRRLAHWQAFPVDPDVPEYSKFFAVIAPYVPMPCPAPEFDVPVELAPWAEQQWKRLGLEKDRPPIVLFLGGNLKRADRLWPPLAWAQLARLLENHNLAPLVALCPPPGLRGRGIREGDFYADFRSALGHHIPVFDEPGLPQAAAFLKQSRLFLCSDGGLFHIAAAAGVPTLGLFFSTDPAHWKPPLASVTCLRAPDGNPSRLTADRVLQAVLKRTASLL